MEQEGEDPRAEQGYIHAGPAGAGHFVKMVHNGIEYGLMQAYAEGFDILKGRNSAKLPAEERFDLNLTDIAEVWRRGSVISSWLLDLRPGLRLRRRAVDDRRGDGGGGSGQRPLRGVVRALSQPRGAHIRRSGLVSDALRVRRARGDAAMSEARLCRRRRSSSERRRSAAPAPAMRGLDLAIVGSPIWSGEAGKLGDFSASLSRQRP
jgi:6-phosphogluconate dehydrogenase